MVIGRPKSTVKRTKSSVYITDSSLQKIGKIAERRNATRNAIWQEAVDFYLLNQNPEIHRNELLG
jgi:hypothetical protein